jgi:Ca2+-binding RTX toxin-like protein
MLRRYGWTAAAVRSYVARSRANDRRRGRRPALGWEPLEDRTAPAVFTVLTTADFGGGSLRQAILDANATPGADTIVFDIVGDGGVQTIQPASALPAITEAVTIDGYTQPGSAPNTLPVGNNADIRIVLDGSAAGGGVVGLTFDNVSGGPAAVRGLSVVGFGGFGVHLSGPGTAGVVVAGNFLGLDPAGAAVPNLDGVVLSGGANNNVVGGPDPADRNVASGNVLGGVVVFDVGTDDNLIRGNYAGTDPSGLLARPNGRDGVVVFDGPADTRVVGNVLSGNTRDGIRVDSRGLGVAGTAIEDNLIGLGADGSAVVANRQSGVRLGLLAAGVTVGPGNAVGGNDEYGVRITEGASANVVLGNRIGTAPSGAGARPNLLGGVRIEDGAAGNTVGGVAGYGQQLIAPSPDPSGVADAAVDADGDYLFTAGDTLFRFDRAAGTTAVVATAPIPEVFTRVVVAPDGTVYGSLTGEGDRVVRVEDGGGLTTVASGGFINFIDGLGVTAAGLLLIVDQFDEQLIRVDPALPIGSNQTLVTSGGNLALVSDVAEEAAGTYVVIGYRGRLVRVDPDTGAQSVIALDGGGHPFSPPRSIGTALAVGPDGGLYATGSDGGGPTGGLYRFDPVTGARTEVASGGRVNDARGVAVLPGGDFLVGGGGGGLVRVVANAARNTISGNSQHGVRIDGPGATGNVVAGNYIGTDAGGTVAVGNGAAGVWIEAGASDNTIGGPGPAARNLISGNTSHGVMLNTPAGSGNRVQGNLIGTDITGLLGLGNGGIGVSISNGSGGNLVGTDGDGVDDATEGNVISGNGARGVFVNGSDNVVAGNVIGLGADGTTPLGNSHVGIQVLGPGSANNRFGTDGDGVSDALERNVISANTLYGIQLAGDGVSNNLIAGNYIGTDATGTLDRGNLLTGVIIHSGAADNNTVGGTLPAMANVISGNDFAGMSVSTTGNTVLGNFIGTNAAGTAALPNNLGGIAVGGTNNTIGGSAAGAGNVISGNAGYGVQLGGATGAVVQGNRIGTNAAGTAAVPNTSYGVELVGGASDNTIGGAAAGAANLISGNGNTGVRIAGAGTGGNTVAGNYIGTDAAGTAALGNGTAGVLIEAGASGNTVGGPTAVPGTGAGNVISGNLVTGVRIADETTAGNQVAGNVIGLNAAGTAAVANFESGVIVRRAGPGNVIGGAAASVRNVISGNRDGSNAGSGVVVVDTPGTVIAANYIGTDLTGTVAIGNQSYGIQMGGGAGRVGTDGDGLSDDAEGNLISGNGLGGVIIGGSGNDTEGVVVAGNVIGLNAAGTAALGNGPFGGVIFSTLLPVAIRNNRIGTNADGVSDELERNVISGNAGPGVHLLGFTGADVSGNVVAGNYIGTDAAGTAAIGNGSDGVDVTDGAANNTVGGTAPGAGNLLSGNGRNGVSVRGGAAGTTIAGNRIGTDAAGTAALGNAQAGVFVGRATGTLIGGTAPGAGNLLSGNGTHGVRLDGDESTGTRIEGNLIGTDAAGAAAVGNDNAGVVISNGASGNTVGGPDPAAANTISGNGSFGVYVAVTTEAPSPVDNLIAGNRIGTDVSGLLPLGNASDGVLIGFGAADTTVGRPAADDADPLGTYGNVIGANGGVGVRVEDFTSGTAVRGNFIGTDRGRTAALGNAGDGVRIDTAEVVVGGVADPAEGNAIAHNLGAGVLVLDQGITFAGGPRDGNRIRGNAIYLNVGIGIDLGTADGADGVTANDPGDLDDGPNGRLNFPVLTAAEVVDGQLLVSGVARPGNLIDVYAADLTRFGTDADRPNGFGQGRAYLGTVVVPAGPAASYGPKPVGGVGVGSDAATAFTLALPLPTGFAVGTPVVATATTPDGTSEFGNNVPVRAAALALVLDPPAVDEGGTTVLRGAFPVADPSHAHTVRIDWGDGTTETRPVPAGEAAFAVPHPYLDNPAGSPDGSFPVAVTVTDDVTGVVQSAVAGVTVRNVAPTVRIVTAPGTSPDASRVVLAAEVTDPGVLDTFTYRWVATVNGRVVGGADGPTFTFDRSTAGVSVVTLTVTDDDGGFGADTAAVASLTPGNDAVTLTPADVPAGVDRLVLFALAGDDAVDASALAVAVELVGGDGDDTLVGGSGDNVLRDGMGDDRLVGGPGTNLFELSPGSSDTVVGGSGNDTISFRASSAGVTFSLAETDAQNVFSDDRGDHYVTASGVENLYGSDHADDLTGDGGANLIFGGAGRDTIRGGGGDDVIYGGTGSSSDTVAGGAGDVIFGGVGRDTIVGGGGDDVIYGGTGGSADTVGGGAGDVIFGGAGRDTIVGGGGDDVIYGDAAVYLEDPSDPDSGVTVEGGGADDLIFGGVGRDTIRGGGGNDIIYGGTGSSSDTVGGAGNSDVIFGGAGADTIRGGPGDDIIYGGAGTSSDTVGGGAGDVIYGGVGADTIAGGGGDDVIYGGTGTSSDTVAGGAGDVIYGGAGRDTIRGGGGDDVIYGDAALYLEDPDDLLSGVLVEGDGSDDLIFGGVGRDTIRGGGGNDIIYGGTGTSSDTVGGGGAGDVIFGGAGRDTIRTGGGDDVIYGDDGIDTVEVTADADLTATGDAAAATVAGGGMVKTLFGVEVVVLAGGPGDNRLDAAGFAGPVALSGGAGNDTLLGGPGDDTLEGGAGDDRLGGGEGADTYLFPGGDLGGDTVVEDGDDPGDELSFNGFAGPVTLDLGSTAPQVVSPGDLVLTLSSDTGIEDVFGSAFGDVITGNDRDNVLTGGGGLDVLDGRAGDDVLRGGATQVVYVDFDTFTGAGDHVYTAAERTAILDRVRAVYAGFDYEFVTDRPADGPFVAVAVNKAPEVDGVVLARAGGRASELDWRNADRGGAAEVDTNFLLAAPAADTPANHVALTATIIAHEVGHLSGLRHHDAFGPIGAGVFAGAPIDRVLPPYAGPRDAEETRFDLMASPASVGTDLADSLGVVALGARDAVKLAFADTGTVAAETADPHHDPATAQPLTPLPLSVPNALHPDARDAGRELAVTAVGVAGRIGLTAAGASEDDYYSFPGTAGQVVNLEAISVGLGGTRDRVDTMLRVLGPGGREVAFNDDWLEPTDAVVFDLVLPETGTYTVVVDTYADPDNPDPELRVPDTAVGDYELFVYTYAAGDEPTEGGGDVLAPGGGSDRLVGSSGADVYRLSDPGEVAVVTVGGGGRATLDFSGFGAGVAVDLGSTDRQEVGGGLALTLDSAGAVRGFVGTAFADVAAGNALDNVFTAAGDDVFRSGGGTDTVAATATSPGLVTVTDALVTGPGFSAVMEGGAFARAVLTGSPGPDQFVVHGWHGEAFLDGAGEADQYRVDLAGGAGRVTAHDSGPPGPEDVLTVRGARAPVSGGPVDETFLIDAGSVTVGREVVGYDESIERLVIDGNGGTDGTVSGEPPPVVPIDLIDITPGLNAGPTAAALDEGGTFARTGIVSFPAADRATVDYGRGAGPVPLALTPLGGVKTFALSETYPSDGPFVVRVTVFDAGGNPLNDPDAAGDPGRIALAVANVPPAVRRPGNQVGYRLVETHFDLGSFADPGADGPWEVTVDWGDGGPNTVFSVAEPGPLGARPHTYAARPPFGFAFVRVTVREGAAPFAAGTAEFFVPVEAPAIISGEAAVPEGGTFRLTLPDLTGRPPGDPLHGIGRVLVLWGDGAEDETGPPAGQTLEHAYAADGPADLRVEAFVEFAADPGFFLPAGAVGLAVADAPPAVGLGGPDTVPEGSAYTLTLGPVSDPGDDTITTFTIHWGDGVRQVVRGAPGGPGNESRTHTYADDGAYTITVDATDEDGTHVGVGTRAVAVTDVPPTVELIAVGHVLRGSPLVLGFGPVVDPGADVVTGYTIDWGDGSPPEPFAGSPAGRTHPHTYAAVGTYTVAVALTNEDGTFSPAGTTAVVVDPPPAPTRLAFGVEPSAVVVGGAITPAVTVRLLTDGGDLSDSTAPVTIALAADPGGATLGGALTVNAVGGVATFADLTLDRVGSGYALRATSPGLAEAVSAPFDVTLPPPGVRLVGSELYVVGTAGNDVAAVSPIGARADGSTGVSVVFSIGGADGAVAFPAPITAARVFFGPGGGDAGSDVFGMTPALAFPAFVTLGAGTGVVRTGAGNDVVGGGHGSYVIVTEGGHDTVTVGNGTNTIQTGAGNDLVVAGDGRNAIDGGAGNDLLVGGRYAPPAGDPLVTTIAGGSGNDLLVAGSAAARRDGDTLRRIADDWARYGPTAANLTNIRGRLAVTYAAGRYRLLGQAGTDWFWFDPSLPRGTVETDRTSREPLR